MLRALSIIVGIILVDLALSGDNALVIGATAASLPRRQRLFALMVGGAGAIVLRIVLAIAATLLLQLPLLQAIGGAILLIIAYRLLAEREARRREAAEGERGKQEAAEEAPRRFLSALLAIIVADVTMSLDNVLSVGALAQGQVVWLAIGLLISIAILLVGSALVAELIGRVPLLLDVAALVLAWTAAHMALSDARLGPHLTGVWWSGPAIYVGAIALVFGMDLVLRRRTARALAPAHAKS